MKSSLTSLLAHDGHQKTGRNLYVFNCVTHAQKPYIYYIYTHNVYIIFIHYYNTLVYTRAGIMQVMHAAVVSCSTYTDERTPPGSFVWTGFIMHKIHARARPPLSSIGVSLGPFSPLLARHRCQ